MTIVNRLDNKCQAKILFSSADRVLLTAFWPAAPHDKRFEIVNGQARNTVEVSRDYFERRYGKVL